MTPLFSLFPSDTKGAVTAVPKKKNILLDKLKESLASVLPITGIVLLLTSTIAPLPVGAMMAFVIGAIMLIFGMALFTLGTEMAMTPLGERVGVVMTKSRNLKIIIPVCFAIGVMITMSEPDLTVLATQVPSIPNMAIILSVAVGVGAFLVVALLRIVIGIRLSNMLVVFYALVFILAFFAPNEFLAVAFDSGGVTTGPMTVPFIMALGVGISSIRSDRHAENDSFGMVALCSVGPILAVLVLSLIYRPGESLYTPAAVPEIGDSRELALLFVKGLPAYISEVFVALAPILAFFLIFQLFFLKLPMRSFLRYAIGLLYTYVGLVLFLTGVNVGFMPVGMELGRVIASQSVRWLLIPIGMVIGYFIVAAEPAVHVLNKQVETITAGAIPQKAMSASLSIGVSISLGLAMTRVLTGLSIMWFLIPGYALALILTKFVPKIFTSIAFDSGGVASGPMTATFLLPFAVGACDALGGSIVSDAFGVVAMVAMTPLITIQLLGVFYQFKLKRQSSIEPEIEMSAPEDEEIIEL
ncbi:MAG: DUF1538 domain-containing protein [Clostridiales bacterium]|nr:DUF1538 domain-containing protein [Clostridiales bacterium]